MAAALTVPGFAAMGQPLVIHEWGTFTSLQDETGRALPGINSDDEPVPFFCHDLAGMLIQRPSAVPPAISKGVSRCHPDVTMRLETPVIYFHPPPGAPVPMRVSLRVAMRGGWLTQFYPAAEAGGFAAQDHLTDATTGTLAWNDLSLGGTATGPETTDRVWTAPRAVAAATVTTTNQESEKFLFYRGVGHVLSPLRVTRTADLASLECRAEPGCIVRDSAAPVRHLWLAAFRPNGTCAFRPLPPVTIEASHQLLDQPPLFSTPASFADADYAPANVAALRRQMRQALQDEGLFADEADALLNTWEASYFQSGGLRLFFLVPRGWTDTCLPLEVSVPCEIKRVMVGRIELVTPEQRRLLRQLAGAAAPTHNWALDTAAVAAPLTGGMPRAYLDLGRFRNALVLDEEKTHPTRSLDAFIKVNGLQGFAAFGR